MSVKRKLGGGAGQITASNVAAILGRDPYKGKVEVYHRLVNGYRVETTEAMTRGHFFETFIRDFCGQGVGHEYGPTYTVHRCENLIGAETVDHPTDPRFAASPDGLVTASAGNRPVIGIWEGKTANSRGSAWNNGTPDHYLLQCQHLMFVLGLDRVWLTCLLADTGTFRIMKSLIVDQVRRVAGQHAAAILKDLDRGFLSVSDILTPKQYDLILGYGVSVIMRFLKCEAVEMIHDYILRDPTYERDAVPVLSDFFENHIKPKRPPEMDGSAAAAEIIAERGLSDHVVEIEKNETLYEILEKYEAAHLDAKRAAAEKDRLKAAAFEAMNGAKKAVAYQTVNGKRRTRFSVSRSDKTKPGKLDVDRVRAERPDVIAEFLTFDQKAFLKARPDLFDLYSSKATESHDVTITIKAKA